MATQKKSKSIELKPIKPVIKSAKSEKQPTKKASKVVKSAPKKVYKKKADELTGTEYDLNHHETPLEPLNLDKKTMRRLHLHLAVHSLKNYFKTLI